MNIRATFKINVPDYRRAVYFGLIKRNKKAVRIAVCVLLAVFSYTLFILISHAEPVYLILFAAGGYLLWGLIQAARQEREIRAYIKNKDSFLGKPFEVSIDDKHMRVRMPENGVDNTFEIKKLTVVFELSDLFIVYISMKNAFLLPKRALSEEEVILLRKTFASLLGDKFESRQKK